MRHDVLARHVFVVLVLRPKLERYAFMKLNTNAGPRTNRNILRRGGTIPDPWRTILYRRYTGLGGRGYLTTRAAPCLPCCNTMTVLHATVPHYKEQQACMQLDSSAIIEQARTFTFSVASACYLDPPFPWKERTVACISACTSDHEMRR